MAQAGTLAQALYHGLLLISNSLPPPTFTATTCTYQVVHNPMNAVRAKIDKSEQLTLASYKQPTYVPQDARRVFNPNTRSFDGEVEDEHELQKRGQVLTIADFDRSYQAFQVASHKNKKVHFP